MTSSSAGTHEPRDQLRPDTLELHRAVVSLVEELEAVDWYQQRADACGDDELTAVLEHNRDEEVEHAMMVLEWIRRHDPVFDRHMRTYLFREEPIVGLEASSNSAPPPLEVHLGIGSLREAG